MSSPSDCESGVRRTKTTNASGDLGYAYGSCEVRARASDEKPAERGYYARVWRRRRGGPWRVVLNVVNPAP